jgi:hypothetical protein
MIVVTKLDCGPRRRWRFFFKRIKGFFEHLVRVAEVAGLNVSFTRCTRFGLRISRLIPLEKYALL